MSEGVKRTVRTSIIPKDEQHRGKDDDLIRFIADDDGNGDPDDAEEE